ncbi:hypothetical protein ACHAXS_007799 [Conticribra weissflogii]
MVLDRCDAADGEGTDAKDSTKPTIIGGAAIEYYKQARVGLLSYIVLSDEYRGRGLSKMLHQEAMRKLDILSNNYCKNGDDEDTTPTLRAVFAETNTPAAGDVSPEESLVRHNALYNLGYRLLQFPYAQPPLTTEDLNGSFDEIVLLVYFPFRSDDLEDLLAKDGLHGVSKNAETSAKLDTLTRYCHWFHQMANVKCNNFDTVKMDADIPFQYVEDFYQSVFGYETDAESGRNIGDDGIPDYRTADYYRLAYWFTRERISRNGNNEDGVSVPVSVLSPPWDDCKESLAPEWKKWELNK